MIDAVGGAGQSIVAGVLPVTAADGAAAGLGEVLAVSGLLEGKSPVITLLIIYAFVTLFNFFVSSGSGKAVVMMPILQPLGQVLGINQQVMVLAYQYGDGFTNTFWPTASLLQLSLCGMDYGHWFKFAWKFTRV